MSFEEFRAWLAQVRAQEHRCRRCCYCCCNCYGYHYCYPPSPPLPSPQPGRTAVVFMERAAIVHVPPMAAEIDLVACVQHVAEEHERMSAQLTQSPARLKKMQVLAVARSLARLSARHAVPHALRCAGYHVRVAGGWGYCALCTTAAGSRSWVGIVKLCKARTERRLGWHTAATLLVLFCFWHCADCALARCERCRRRKRHRASWGSCVAQSSRAWCGCQLPPLPSQTLTHTLTSVTHQCHIRTLRQPIQTRCIAVTMTR